MSIPDAAIEAAAEAVWSDRAAVVAALEAAMPAIREAIAQEIEAGTQTPMQFGDFYDGCNTAVRIVRGGAV